MLKRHYFIGNFIFNLKEVICLDTEIIHHIKDVLKLKEGEEVMLCDGQGKAAIVKIEKIDKKEINFFVRNFLPSAVNDKKIVLYAALLKRDSFEWLLQKATEAGVSEIVPIVSERTVKIGLNEKRWQKIIKEAAEQSQSLILPKLHQIQNFKEAVKNKNGIGVFFDPAGEDIKNVKINDSIISLFVGPEGGWTDKEIQLCRDSGLDFVNLGTSILRAETAATVAVYLAKNLF
ncbi:MAG: 16S rRNA (uracil(1498)-N(3))-methyltransferase [Candidatus Magasanikbacteria bacterium]|nr:16S rRNA (uracil(1498)-N(3))-methyltransferase [Candidatus Magasanikbacteria bacterium]